MTVNFVMMTPKKTEKAKRVRISRIGEKKIVVRLPEDDFTRIENILQHQGLVTPSQVVRFSVRRTHEALGLGKTVENRA